ncbi:MAG: RNA-binding protein [SAR202 cluster bacterium]|nr:RNA-binding protein [SAR202 cluster bacterium]
MKIYVGNLSFKETDDSLRQTFSQFGEVTSARIVTDRDSNRSRGFGFVEMSNDAEAKSAIAALSGKEINGRQLTVNEAKPQEPRTGGGGRGFGGGGGGAGGFGGGAGRGPRW